jgi:hypothetical protein
MVHLNEIVQMFLFHLWMMVLVFQGHLESAYPHSLTQPGNVSTFARIAVEPSDSLPQTLPIPDSKAALFRDDCRYQSQPEAIAKLPNTHQPPEATHAAVAGC